LARNARVGSLYPAELPSGEEKVLDLRLSVADMDAVLDAPQPALGNRSWRSAFRADVQRAIRAVPGKVDLVLLTGGRLGCRSCWRRASSWSVPIGSRSAQNPSPRLPGVWRWPAGQACAARDSGPTWQDCAEDPAHCRSQDPRPRARDRRDRRQEHDRAACHPGLPGLAGEPDPHTRRHDQHSGQRRERGPGSGAQHLPAARKLSRAKSVLTDLRTKAASNEAELAQSLAGELATSFAEQLTGRITQDITAELAAAADRAELLIK
jgi:hypothetical protein